MPIIGIVDPSHKQRGAKSYGKLPPWYSIDDLWAESQNLNPKWSPWPFELIQAVLGEYQDRGDRLSTTAITSACPRGLVLERKEPFIATLDEFYASLRGTMIHRTLEAYARQGAIAEARFYTTIDGIEISGSPDLLTTTTVYDWKTTENPPTFGYPYRHHTEQVMINAYIARHAEKWDVPPSLQATGLPFDPRENPATSAAVVYLGPKGPKVIVVERKEEFMTPAGKLREAKRPYVWSDEETLKEVRPRLHAIQDALEAYPEWVPGNEDIWGGEPSYTCPGPPLCYLPNCLAKRKLLVWDHPDG